MNSDMVINIARKGAGFKGWYLNKTLGGKCILRKALSDKYGKRQGKFGDGILKYEKEGKNSITINYINNRFKSFLRNICSYNDEGKRTHKAVFYLDPNNPRYKTSLHVDDFVKSGKRVYELNRYRYNADRNNWKHVYNEKTTMDYSSSEIKIKCTMHDYLNGTTDTLERNYAKKSPHKAKPANNFVAKIRKILKI